jgi:amylosucrase
LYNYDPVTGDARFCGTTASMCGIEKAGYEQDEAQMELAIRRVLTLHAYMFTQSGIPMLYSGDEIGQLNDYDYKLVPEKVEDSRYIHRGKFSWEDADKIDEPGSVQGRLFRGLEKLETIRRNEKVFMTSAKFYTVETGDDSVLGIAREYEGEKLIGLFNFSSEAKVAKVADAGKSYTDLLTGKAVNAEAVQLLASGFVWMKRG